MSIKHSLDRLVPKISWIRGRAGTIFLSIVLVLFVVSSFGTAKAAMTNPEKPEENTLLTYQHRGEFNYRAYVKPVVEDAQENTISFFTRIIESTVLSFAYKFVPDQPVELVSSEVEVNATIRDPGNWEKKIPISFGPRKLKGPAILISCE